MRLREKSGFTLECYPPSTLVPFPVLNRVFNLAARMTGDRQFGARVGQAVRLEDAGAFVEYALQGETLGDLVARANAAQPLHTNQLIMDLRVFDGQAHWRILYRTHAEPTVEHHAQLWLLLMLSSLRRTPGARNDQIEIHLADPYVADARLLESRLDIRARPRASDYELTFPAQWLNGWTPVAGLPPDLFVEVLGALSRPAVAQANGGSGDGRPRTPRPAAVWRNWRRRR